jgi:hypothetical protein
MSDHLPGKIEIGGPIPRSLIPGLCDAIKEEGINLGWSGETFHPECEDDLLQALEPQDMSPAAPAVITLCHEEASYGHFEGLEHWLTENKIAWDRLSEDDGDFAFYRPGDDCETSLVLDDDGNPIVALDDVVEIRDLLRKGLDAEALKLAEEVCDECTIPPMTSFTIVDG